MKALIEKALSDCGMTAEEVDYRDIDEGVVVVRHRFVIEGVSNYAFDHKTVFSEVELVEDPIWVWKRSAEVGEILVDLTEDDGNSSVIEASIKFTSEKISAAENPAGAVARSLFLFDRFDKQLRKAVHSRKMNVGTCRLCNEADSELRWSHVIPRAVYKFMQDAAKKSGGKISSTKQLANYLFCDACEAIFQKSEDDFFPFMKGEVPLMEGLHPVAGNRSGCYEVRPDKEEDVDLFFLERFVLSSLYRFHCMSRLEVLSPIEEAFRLYVVGEGPKPDADVVVVYERPPEGREFQELSDLLVTSEPAWFDEDSFFVFHLPRFKFLVGIGKNRPNVGEVAVAGEGRAPRIIVSEQSWADTLTAAYATKK